jgi:hypothetical protein
MSIPHKNYSQNARCQWLTPVIFATWETEMGRMAV